MKFLQLAPGKSGAREVAVAMFMLWAFLVCWLHFWINKEDVAFYRESFSTVTTAVFGFGLGAFGIASIMGRLGSPAGNEPQPRRAVDRERPRPKNPEDFGDGA